MAWKAIPGFLLKDFWFPFQKTHVVKPVAVPAKDCENLCAATKDCCRWGVREVKGWADAKDADKGFTHLGWEIHGADLKKFTEATWCAKEACAEGGADKFSVTVKDEKDVLFHLKDVKAAEFPVAKFPGKDGSKFYVFVVLSNEGWELYDKDGNKVGSIEEVDALKNLAEVPKDHAEVTFVKSYSCGLFKKEAPAAKLRLESLKCGFLKKCEHGHESITDADKAFAAVLDKDKGGKWSVDASAGHGISFASIVCAVFSSVALVFLVLFVAKKNSQIEVVVADE